MKRFIVLNRRSPRSEVPTAWGPYLQRLRASGRFEGGSSIGDGHRLTGSTVDPVSSSDDLVGYLIVVAESLASAEELVLPGHPTHEAGGTVEIRELVVD